MSRGLWCSTCNAFTGVDIMDDKNAVQIVSDNMSKILCNLRDEFPWNAELINLAETQAQRYILDIPRYQTSAERLEYAKWIASVTMALLRTSPY